MRNTVVALFGLTLALSACGSSPEPTIPNALSTLAQQAGCLPVNVALNKRTTASSIEMDWTVATNAVDGNANTRWSSQFSDPQWLQVDLGRPQVVCGVTLAWEAAYGKAFRIEVSNGDDVWIPIYETTSGSGGTQTITPTRSVPGRYVRMYGTVRGNNGGALYGYSLYEFQVNVQGGDTVTNTYSDSVAGGGGTAWAPSETGFAYPSGTLKGTLTGTQNFSLFLERQQGLGWVTVARDTGFGSADPSVKSVSYTTPSGVIDGTYRWKIYNPGTDSGSYTLVEQR
ncbi:discoidin domain-containing protein [Deinococcus sp.]|uniref:discoidin domain-containing protein n=1 Tax=Deinococcus sp. TaxID=47478 RepID=UPI003B5A8C09